MNECLYRFYDNVGTLLYVGITKDWHARIRSHEKSADFYSAVAKITFERFPDRESLEAAEVLAIEEEDPLYNRADNPNYATWQTHFRQLLDWSKNKPQPDEKHRYVVSELLRGAGEDDDRFTGKWLAKHYPAEWYEANAKGLLDCSLCYELARHATVHSWGWMKEEL